MDDQAKAIKHKREKWISAVNSGDIDKYLSILSNNIIWFTPAGQVINGKKEFQNWVEPFFKQFDYDFSLDQSEVNFTDDWAVERGRFISKLTPKAGGEEMEHSGHFIVFWHREENDLWKLERYVDITQF